MPELPDVERFRTYLDATALHATVARVTVREPDMLENLSPRTLQRHLQGRTFEATDRHGKYLFVRLDSPETLVMHFGMTGFLQYYQEPRDAPQHARIVYHFDNGYQLAYVCQRKLGLVTLTGHVDGFVNQRDLGPDALDDGLTLEVFRSRLAGRRGAIKSTLMNQSILAGIGNLYSDEILFQARLNPSRSVDTLEDRDLRTVFRAIRNVLETAVDRNGEIERLPKSYLLPHRDTDQKCPRCGGDLATAKVSGRTSHFCPKCQE